MCNSEILREYTNLINKRNDFIHMDKNKEDVEKISKTIETMEIQASLDNKGLSNLMKFLKHGDNMDKMPLEKRQGALEFSHAMTSLEGIRKDKETNDFFGQWKRGNASFFKYCIRVLERFGVLQA